MTVHPPRRALLRLGLAAAAACVAAPALARETPANAKGYANPHLLISAADLAKRARRAETDSLRAFDGAGLVLLDVRPIEAYRGGRIPGARPLDPNAVADPAAPVGGALRPIPEIAAMLGRLGIAADTEVVLYDDRGGFHAARMFWLLEYLGHRKVKLLDGGLKAWRAEKRPLADGPAAPAPKPRRFTPSLSPRRHATADYILERRADPETLVVDVRPVRLFSKGHIPWAKNIPWQGNLRRDAGMKSAAELRARFEGMGVTPDKNVVVHCENGLASAHSYVALRLLGYPRVRTYHRSWSEWGAADDLPKTASARRNRDG